MMKPTVHMNGTSRQELLKGYVNAITKLNEAMDALQYAGPNGRDYYVQSPSAFQFAAVEHRNRAIKVQSVIDELQEIAESLV